MEKAKAKAKRNRNTRRRERVKAMQSVESVSQREGEAVVLLGQLRPQVPGTKVTCSIPWSPKALGKTGKFKPRRDTMRACMVRGSSNRTPKIVASYVRCFGTD